MGKWIGFMSLGLVGCVFTVHEEPDCGPKGDCDWPSFEDTSTDPWADTDFPGDETDVTVVDPGDEDADGDGFTPNEGDLDDSNATIYPNAPEIEDGLDNDQDGLVDEDSPPNDFDGDGYSLPEDCDDLDAASYPGAPEIKDYKDNDCDGVADEGL